MNIGNELEKIKVRQCNDLLVVIDYTMTYLESVAKYLFYLSETKENRFKTRVILVDRDQRHITGNRDSLDYGFSQYFPFLDSDEQIHGIQDMQFGGYPLIQTDHPDKTVLMGMMMQYARVELGKEMEDSLAESLYRSLSEIDPFCQRPLYALFLTDAWAMGNKSLKTTNEVLDFVIDRELDELVAKAGIDKDIDSFKQAILTVLSFATFNKGIDVNELKKVANHSCGYIDENLPGKLGLLGFLGCAGWLNDTMVSAFQPDMIGEYFVLVFMRSSKNARNLLGNDWYAKEDPRQFVINLCNDFPREIGHNDVFWNFMLGVLPDEAQYMNYANMLKDIFLISDASIKGRIIAKLLVLAEKTHDSGNKDKLDQIIATAYRKKGEFKNSLEYHERSLNFRLEQYGEDHPLTATAYNNIGDVYRVIGDYDRALQCYEKAFSIRDQTLGSNHLSTYISKTNIGKTYFHLGNYKEALKNYLMAYIIRWQKTGNDHPDIAKLYNNIGSAYEAMGEYDKALKFYKKAIAIFEKHYGGEHPDIAASYNNVGGTYYLTGEYDKALSYYLKDKSILETTLGKSNPEIASNYNNIALTYKAMGKYDKALEYYERAVLILEKTLEGHHPDIAATYSNIGLMYTAMQDHDKAIRYCRKAAMMFERTLKQDHPDIAVGYNNLAVVYFEAGKFKLAIKYFYKAFLIWETAFGSSSQIAKDCSHRLIGAYNRYMMNGGKRSDLDQSIKDKIDDIVNALALL